MKKTLTKLILLPLTFFALTGGCTSTSYSQQSRLKIGDPMPEPAGDALYIEVLVHKFEDKRVLSIAYGNSKTGNVEQIRGYLVCGKEFSKKSFGYFNVQTKILYIDNKPTDGIIDGIVENVEARTRDVDLDIPGCTEKFN